MIEGLIKKKIEIKSQFGLKKWRIEESKTDMRGHIVIQSREKLKEIKRKSWKLTENKRIGSLETKTQKVLKYRDKD